MFSGESFTWTAELRYCRLMLSSQPAVLVVEDEPDQRELVTTYLTGSGYRVLAAESAEDALRLIESFRLVSAIVDLRLPGMDGSALTALLRATRPDCRLVVTSVLDAEDYPPADALLPKPFTRAQLLAAITVPGPIPAQRVSSSPSGETWMSAIG